jgi:DsbC/DsbD-like thiol-disulfide interchange protein
LPEKPHQEAMLKYLTTALALCLSLATQARAQTSMETLVRVKVLDGGKTASGSYMAALQFTLAKGWKTYWRSPGDAGIPPRFDWSESENVGDVAILWPTPIVFVLYGLQSIGYYDELILPIEITPASPGKPVQLRGYIEIGVCEDVCVPAAVSVDRKLDANARRDPRITTALANRPMSAKQAGVRDVTCTVTAIEDGMRLTARVTMPTAGNPEVIVIEPGNPLIWASPTESSRQGKVLTASSDLMHVSGGVFALDRSAVRITVLGKSRAVDILGCTTG